MPGCVFHFEVTSACDLAESSALTRPNGAANGLATIRREPRPKRRSGLSYPLRAYLLGWWTGHSLFQEPIQCQVYFNLRLPKAIKVRMVGMLGGKWGPRKVWVQIPKRITICGRSTEPVRLLL